MKRKTNIWITLGKYLAFAFLLGYLFSFVMYQGYWYPIIDGIKMIPWYGWIFGFILIFFLTLLIHELGHLIAFLIQGVRIRALYLFIFVFFRSETGLKFTIQPKLWYLIGGFVVPDIPIIHDEESYQFMVKKFARSLITAPIVTIAFMLILDFVFLLTVYLHASSTTIGWLFLSSLFTTLISLVYIKTFSLSNQSFYGDFVAYKKIHEDLVFQIIQIVQYRQFSLTEDEKTQNFLYEKLCQTIQEIKLSTSLFHQVFLMQYIESVIYEKMPKIDKISLQIEIYPKNHLYRTLEGLSLLYDIAAYHYVSGQVEKAYLILEQNAKKASQKIDEKQRKYLDLKFRHILNLSYHEKELNNKERVSIGKEELFAPILDLNKLQKESHEPLPFQEWSCPVVLLEIVDENKNITLG
jgi:signal transduction histidine kinase